MEGNSAPTSASTAPSLVSSHVPQLKYELHEKAKLLEGVLDSLSKEWERLEDFRQVRKYQKCIQQSKK